MSERSGLVAALLAYADRPWRAVVVVVLLIVGGVGWVAYERRDAIIESWLTPTEPYLRTTLVPAALDKLVIETSADLAQVWEINLISNAQTFLAARRADGERPVVPSPRRLPIITSASDARTLVALLDGAPVCVDINAAGTPLVERFANRGMRRGCAVPIPPNSESFVGVVYIAWAVPPDERSETVAVAAARDIARTLATR